MTNPAYELAKKDLGTWEWAEGANPKVIQYFRDVGHSWVTDDSTAWCAAFVGAMLKRAGMAHTGKLNARSYTEWGENVELEHAEVGDLVVFWRVAPNDWRGHVGFLDKKYDGSDYVEILGGNQRDQVNVRKYPTSRILAVRRPPHAIVPTPPSFPTAPAQGANLETLRSAVEAMQSHLDLMKLELRENQ